MPVVSCVHMHVVTTLDFLYLALAIAVLWIGGFLTWCLYELGKLLHQANATVADARDKVKRIERAVMTVKEKMETLSGYAGMAAKAGKSIASMLGMDGEDEERPRRRRK